MNAIVLALFDSPLDIGVVVLIVLLLFGSSQLPKLARSLGSAQREFRKGIEEDAQAAEVEGEPKHLPSAPVPSDSIDKETLAKDKTAQGGSNT